MERLGRGGSGALVARFEDVEAGMTVHPRAVTVTARSLSVANGLLEAGLVQSLQRQHSGTNQEVKNRLHGNLSREQGRVDANSRIFDKTLCYQILTLLTILPYKPSYIYVKYQNDIIVIICPKRLQYTHELPRHIMESTRTPHRTHIAGGRSS